MAKQNIFSANKASVLSQPSWPPSESFNSAITNHILTFGDFEKIPIYHSKYQNGTPSCVSVEYMWLIVIVN